MAKVKISNDKGLHQVAGSGFQVSATSLIEGQIQGARRPPIEAAPNATLTAGDCGAIVYMSASNSVNGTIDLPTAAAAGAGWYADFILSARNTLPVYIDTQADTTLLFTYQEDGGADGHGKTVATERTLVIAGNVAAGAEFKVVSDGTNYFAHGFATTHPNLSGSGDAPEDIA